MQTTSVRLYTPGFMLLLLSNVLFAGSFSMIIPELPDYLTGLGGEDYKGLIISLFTLSAGLSRPFSGKLADTIGRIPLMIFGTFVCVVCSLFYPILTSVAGFLLLRFFHGFSTGFKPTAATAFVADIVPIARRGEAMGVMGVSFNIGASMFPPIGSYLVLTFSIDAMFYLSSFIALVSVLIILGLKETLPNPEKFNPSLLRLKRDEIIEPKALPIAFVTAIIYSTLGVLLTISPDHSVYLGLENKGLLFTSLTLFTLVSRLIAGRVSDQYGRLPVIKVSMVSLIFSLIYMGMADSTFHLLAAAGALGFSTGIAAPAVFAWVIDISPEDRRGRYMATVYIALEVGIGLGALYSAWMYANNTANFGIPYFFTAGMTLLAVVFVQFYRRKDSA